MLEYLILFSKFFTISSISVYSLPYLILGFLLTIHSLSINKESYNTILYTSIYKMQSIRFSSHFSS
jgi:hypothetical protein